MAGDNDAVLRRQSTKLDFFDIRSSFTMSMSLTSKPAYTLINHHPHQVLEFDLSIEWLGDHAQHKQVEFLMPICLQAHLPKLGITVATGCKQYSGAGLMSLIVMAVDPAGPLSQAKHANDAHCFAVGDVITKVNDKCDAHSMLQAIEESDFLLFRVQRSGDRARLQRFWNHAVGTGVANFCLVPAGYFLAKYNSLWTTEVLYVFLAVQLVLGAIFQKKLANMMAAFIESQDGDHSAAMRERLESLFQPSKLGLPKWIFMYFAGLPAFFDPTSDAANAGRAGSPGALSASDAALFSEAWSTCVPWVANYGLGGVMELIVFCMTTLQFCFFLAMCVELRMRISCWPGRDDFSASSSILRAEFWGATAATMTTASAGLVADIAATVDEACIQQATIAAEQQDLHIPHPAFGREVAKILMMIFEDPLSCWFNTTMLGFTHMKSSYLSSALSILSVATAWWQMIKAPSLMLKKVPKMLQLRDVQTTVWAFLGTLFSLVSFTTLAACLAKFVAVFTCTSRTFTPCSFLSEIRKMHNCA